MAGKPYCLATTLSGSACAGDKVAGDHLEGDRLVGPLEYRQHPSVDVVAAHGELLCLAHAAVDLHRLAGDSGRRTRRCGTNSAVQWAGPPPTSSRAAPTKQNC